jgi:NitT/TauT family transport system substrate-binding protein
MKLKVFGVAILLALAACSPAQRQPAARARTLIRFATDWRAQAEQGGFYEALATGEYAKRGLDVRIVPGVRTSMCPNWSPPARSRWATGPTASS